MNTHADKTQGNKNQSFASTVSKKQSASESTFQFVDNRPEAVTQRKLQEIANNSPQAKQAAQLQAITKNSSQIPKVNQLNTKTAHNHTIQRLESGEDYSHKKLGEEAKENGWWNKDDGEFLAPPAIMEDYDEDTYKFEMHYHQYSGELEKNEDEVSLSGHGVWAKKDGKSRRQKYAITSKKTDGGYWYVDGSSALGDEDLGFEENKNPDAKGKLLGAFDDLKSLVGDTMNSEDNDSDTE